MMRVETSSRRKSRRKFVVSQVMVASVEMKGGE